MVVHCVWFCLLYGTAKPPFSQQATCPALVCNIRRWGGSNGFLVRFWVNTLRVHHAGDPVQWEVPLGP